MARALLARLPRASGRLRAARHAHAVRPCVARLSRETGHVAVIARSLGVVVFVAGAAALRVGLALLGRGAGLPEPTRHLRAMKDRVEPPDQVHDVDMAFFASLPHGAPMARRAELEEQGVRMAGWVQTILLSGDGDIHLELAEKPRTAEDRDTAYVTAEITPPWRAHRRGWAYESLLVAFRPNSGGATRWDAGPRRVRLTGWLLYDHQYDKRASTWLLEHGKVRLTGWEIHPVTSIELWDDHGARWRELAR